MTDMEIMRLALSLARRGAGVVSPNPMVGAVLVKNGKIIGRGWHRRAGLPHGEIEAIHDAQKKGHNPRGATLFVTLEPCCTHGRTPPCTDAILAAGIRRVVVAATDPNPKHAGRGLKILQGAGLRVTHGLMAGAAGRLNEIFNHWIVKGTPFVTLKSAMTLDGKIATAAGESKWITSEKARAVGRKLRREVDAILVGVNTVVLDDPRLTTEPSSLPGRAEKLEKPLRRIVLDPKGRTPLNARILKGTDPLLTIIVVTKSASAARVSRLKKKAAVILARERKGSIDLQWLLQKLGSEGVSSLLVEGGGETHASFLAAGLVQRVVLFYAPKIIGGRAARKSVGGDGAMKPMRLREVEWQRVGSDLMLRALVV